MKDIFNRIYRMSIISSILCLLFGLLLFLQTDNVIKVVSITIGTLLMIIGILPIINYFKNRNQNFFINAGFLYGVFSVVAGLIILINNNILATIIPILIGVWMIVNSVNKIQIAMELRDNNIQSWIITFIFSIIVLIVGVLFILNPLQGSFLIGKTCGILIIIYSVFDIADCIIIKIKAKNIYKEFGIIKDIK